MCGIFQRNLTGAAKTGLSKSGHRLVTQLCKKNFGYRIGILKVLKNLMSPSPQEVLTVLHYCRI
jgi:hypothetical protein